MYQNNLTSLLHKYGRNLPGVCAVIAIEKDGIASMPDALSLMQTGAVNPNCDFLAEEIILKDGYSWTDISKDVNFRVSLGEKEKPGIHGNQFTYTISLILPNDDFETRGKVLRYFDNREWVLIVRERSGAWRLIGSMERGALFTAELATGTIEKDNNEHACGFTWESGQQRAWYIFSLSIGSFFSINIDSAFNSKVQLLINESVIVDWGDGAIETHLTGTDLLTISHTYSTVALFTIKVYHNNRATKLIMQGDGTNNGNIKTITDSLPKSLIELNCSTNNITTAIAISATATPVLLKLNAEYNALGVGTVSDYFIMLNGFGTLNGICQLYGQTPAAHPNSAGLFARAQLLSHGWTVTND